MASRWYLLGLLSCTIILLSRPVICSGEAEADEAKLLARIRQQLRIPASYEIKLGPVEKVDITGLVKRTLAVSGSSRPRTETIYLSEDGRYLFWGRLYDLQAQTSTERFKNIQVEGHPMRGPADARITIVEYSDFQCPFCERAYWTVKYKVLQRYAADVRLVHKNFPLTQIHPWAFKAALAAQCAFEQGNEPFWKMHDLLFENQDELTAENLPSKLREFAVNAELDVEAFTDCYEGEKTAARVKASLEEAESLGLTGTPAFVVNGQLRAGAVPFSAFKAIIERELLAEATAAKATDE